MGTLRSKLIQHGASISFVRRKCSLRLNASFRYKTEVEALLENLRREIELQQVANHSDLRKYQ